MSEERERDLHQVMNSRGSYPDGAAANHWRGTTDESGIEEVETLLRSLEQMYSLYVLEHGGKRENEAWFVVALRNRQR